MTDPLDDPMGATPAPEEPRRGFIARFLDVVEKVGNLLPDPAILFVLALAAAWGLSYAYAGAEYVTAAGPEQVVNQFSMEALVPFFTNMVETFTHFHPIGVVLVAMLGFGVAERAGYINTGLKILLVITPKFLLTPMLALVAIVSHTAVDAGYVLVIPVGGVLFYAAGRHPIAGITAAFAGVSGGFSANFIPSAVDALLAGITEESSAILNPDYGVNPLCNWWFSASSSAFVMLMIWFLTDRIIEPRCNRLFPIDDDADVEPMERISAREVTGFLTGTLAVGVLIYGIVFLALPADSLLRDPVEGELYTAGAPLVQMIVPLLFILALTPGIVHGLVAGTIKKSGDIVAGMVDAMKGMGHYLVIMFFAALFLYVFTQSNLGEWLAISGADWLKSMELHPMITITGIIFLTAFVNLLMGSASAKWALLSVIFVPLLMEVGISPQLTQAAYRVGDSSTNIITPLMPYFPLVVVYCQRYFKKTGIGTLISLMLPYSFTILIGWTVFLLIYWGLGEQLGFTLGIEGGYDYVAPGAGGEGR